MPLYATSDVKNYLEGNPPNQTVRLLPHVSAEFNYNLIYTPYVTFAGNGAELNTSAFYQPASWVSNGLTSVSLNSNGNETSSMTNTNAIELSITPTDLTNYLDYQGGAGLSINLPASVSKCYKVVFYAKSINDSVVSLSTSATASGGATISNNTFGGSFSEDINNIGWTKFSFKIGQRSTDNPFNQILFNFDMVNNNLNALNLTAWGVLISQFRIFEISEFDYFNGSLWNTDSVFTWFRPGESYVRSGNSSVSDSAVLRLRQLLDTNSNGSVLPGWNKQAPCSPIVYSPKILFSAPQQPIFRNGALSPFSNYKYFVSDTGTNQGITSIYSELIDINKIVLKFNISQSIPDNVIVTLKNTPNNIVYNINVHNTDISAAGVCVLYWNGSTFTTSKWTWSPTGNSGMPAIDNTGNVSMYVGGTQMNAYTTIDTVSVTQVSATPILNFANNSNATELSRFQVIEISPRLEIDLSSFVLAMDIKKEFDNSNTPLPISSISANSATLDFSNIPLSGINNYPKSIFSTIANKPNTTKYPNADPNYLPALTGLLTKNTKLYLHYYLPDVSNTVIPAGVYYVDSWDNSDIKQTRANCFDAMKILQTIPVNDYVSEGQSPQNVISNLLDLSGYTDYNYDQLVASLTNNTQLIATDFFYADSTNKTIFQSLQEALLAYQLGAWIDEHGIMRFQNLTSILTNTSPTLYLNDKNVIVDTYNENIKTKVGKILMRYRSPQVKRSVGVNSSTGSGTGKKIVSIFQQAPDIIWQQDSEDVVPFNTLTQSINNGSQNYYTVSPSSYNDIFFSTSVDHSGYCIIENEIVTTGLQEFSLIGMDASGNQIAGASRLAYPKSSSDLSYISAQFSNQYNAQTINQTPTGNYADIKRGLFGTNATSHILLNPGAADTNFYAKFNGYSLGKGYSSFGNLNGITINNSRLISVPVTSNSYSLISPTRIDEGYNTYSVQFRFPNNHASMHAGLFVGLGGAGNLSGAGYVFEVEKRSLKTNLAGTPYNDKYYLNILEVNSSGYAFSIGNSIDITGIINYYHNHNQPNDPLFLSSMGYMINIKFVNNPNNRTLWINQTRYNLDSNSTGPVSTRSGMLTNSGILPTSFQNTNFGFISYVDSTYSSVTSTSVELSEIYATENLVLDDSYYFFQTKEFLNKIVLGQNIVEKSVFAQSKPKIFGLNLYDVQLALSPSLGAEFFKVAYSFPYYPGGNTNTNSEMISVGENSLGYSDIVSTGFRSKFAIVNKSNFAVSTKSTVSNSSLANAELLVSSRSPILLTPQLTLEKVINPQLINEVIEVQSDWIQSQDSAESILKMVALSSDSFSRDILINIFGDPLIQIGDVLQLTYPLKNIFDITFFVSGAEQNWSNGGLVTQLRLNQLTYNNVTRASYDNYYPTKNNINAPIVMSLSPATGGDFGGTTVTITGSGFGTTPLVYFGNQQATVLSASDSSITVTTPPSGIDGLVNVSVIANNIVSAMEIPNASTTPPQTYNSRFTYTAQSLPVSAINSFTATAGTYDTTTNDYPATFTWTLSTSVSNSVYNAYDLTVSNSDGTFTKDYGNVSDAGITHTFTTDPIFTAGTTYTAVITPLNIDNLNNVTKGPTSTTTFTTPNYQATQPSDPAILSISHGTYTGYGTFGGIGGSSFSQGTPGYITIKSNNATSLTGWVYRMSTPLSGHNAKPSGSGTGDPTGPHTFNFFNITGDTLTYSIPTDGYYYISVTGHNGTYLTNQVFLPGAYAGVNNWFFGGGSGTVVAGSTVPSSTAPGNSQITTPSVTTLSDPTFTVYKGDINEFGDTPGSITVNCPGASAISWIIYRSGSGNATSSNGYIGQGNNFSQYTSGLASGSTFTYTVPVQGYYYMQVEAFPTGGVNTFAGNQLYSNIVKSFNTYSDEWFWG